MSRAQTSATAAASASRWALALQPGGRSIVSLVMHGKPSSLSSIVCDRADESGLLPMQQERVESVVEIIDEAAPGTEVRRHLDDGAAAAALHIVACLLVDADVGPAESVD